MIIISSSSYSSTYHDYNGNIDEEEALSWALEYSQQQALPDHLEDEDEDLKLALLLSQQALKQQQDEEAHFQQMLNLSTQLDQQEFENIIPTVSQSQSLWKDSEKALVLANKFFGRRMTIQGELQSILDSLRSQIILIKENNPSYEPYFPPSDQTLENIKRYFYEDTQKLPSHLPAALINKTLCDQLDAITKPTYDLIQQARINSALYKTGNITGADAFVEQLETEMEMLPARFGKDKFECRDKLFGNFEISAESVTTTTTTVNRTTTPAHLSDPHKIEEKLPPKPVIMPLDPSITILQKQIHTEFEARKKRTGAETVMVYASLAADYEQQLTEKITAVATSLKVTDHILTKIKDINDITKWLLTNKRNIDVPAGKWFIIPNVLSEAKKIESSHKSEIILKDKTQYQYMLEVSALVMNLHAYYFPLKKEDDELAAITASYIGSLIEQDRQCQRGMIGRMFQIHLQVLNYLIEKHNNQ